MVSLQHALVHHHAGGALPGQPAHGGEGDCQQDRAESRHLKAAASLITTQSGPEEIISCHITVLPGRPLHIWNSLEFLYNYMIPI